MKIVHSVPSLMSSYGGPAYSVPSLCDWLSRRGEQVEIISTFSNDEKENARLNGRVKVYAVKENHIKRLRLYWAPEYKKIFKQRIKEGRPDLIHNHGLWRPVNHIAVQLAVRNNIPCLISPRGMAEPWALQHRYWKKKLAWQLYQKKDFQRARVLHATSMPEARQLREIGLKHPIALIPNGVHPGKSRNGRGAEEKKERICFFLGRIYKDKGLLNLVEAWSRLKPEGWKVIISGPDESNHRKKVEAAIARHKLGDLFSFTGPVNAREKEAYFMQADLFVLPSFSENFGIVVAEALSHGVPVVTTKGTPWSELNDSKSGWWVDTGVDPLTEALQEATTASPEKLFEMGERGRKMVEKKYSWPVIAESMQSVYHWMINEGPVPECVIL